MYRARPCIIMRPRLHAVALLAMLALLSSAVFPAHALHVPYEEIRWSCGFGGDGQRGDPADCGINPVGGQGVGADGPVRLGSSWINADDEVLGLEQDGLARAYPLKLLTPHEIVNDVIDGVPLAVTYCPLCGSGIAFERTVELADGPVVLDFAASGFLWQHDLVMWDPATSTLWNQITGEAIGTLRDGRVQEDHIDVRLVTVPVTRTTWEHFHESHPEARMVQPVHTKATYDRDAYSGYSTSCQFGVSRQVDCDLDGLHPKAEVVGVPGPRGAAAFALLGVLSQGGVAFEPTTGTVLVAELDGALRAYDAKNHSFEARDGFWVDESGRPWNLQQGARADGSEQLKPIPAHRMFWFAWQGHYPETTLWLPPQSETPQPPEPRDDGRMPGFWIPVTGAILAAAAMVYRRRA